MVDFAQVINQVKPMLKLTAVGYVIQLDSDDGMWSYLWLKYWKLCIISGLTLALTQEATRVLPLVRFTCRRWQIQSP